MEEQQNYKPLFPKNEAPKLFGRIIYNESSQSWNIIRLKKEVLARFPQLREKAGSFCYKMNMYNSYKEIITDLKKMEKAGEVVPFLLALYKKKVEN